MNNSDSDVAKHKLHFFQPLGSTGNRITLASYPDVSLDENLRAKEGGKGENRRDALRFSSLSFPWSFALRHQSLACHSLFALASVREAKRLRRIRNYALLRTNSRTQFILTMYIGLQCLLVKINYSNLCLKVGLVHEKFDV